MKKLVAGLLAVCLLLGFAACGGKPAAESTSTAELPGLAEVNSAVEQRSTPQAAEDSPAEEQQDAPAEIDLPAFKEFVEESGLGIFAEGDIPAEGTFGGEVLSRWSGYGLVSWVLNYGYGAYGMGEGIKLEEDHYGFTREELVQTAEELFGGRYDITAALNSGEANVFKEDGYLTKTWGFGPTYWGEPDWDSFTYEDGVAAVTLEFDSQSGSVWTTRFYFAPRPGNTWAKYEIVSSEELDRQDMVEPDIMFDQTVAYRTTAALNLRRGPGTEYEPPMWTLDAGYEVWAAGKMAGNDEWVFVYEGMSGGWVSLEFLEPA